MHLVTKHGTFVEQKKQSEYQDIYHVTHFSHQKGTKIIESETIRVLFKSDFAFRMCSKCITNDQCQHINIVKQYKETNGASNKDANLILTPTDASITEYLVIKRFDITFDEAIKMWRQQRKKIKNQRINDPWNEPDRRLVWNHRNTQQYELLNQPICSQSKYIYAMIIRPHPYFKFSTWLLLLNKSLCDDDEINPDHDLKLCVQQNHPHKYQKMRFILETLKNQICPTKDFSLDKNDYIMLEDVMKNQCAINDDKCKKNQSHLKRCKHCGMGYCCRKHQKIDWNRNFHILQCKIRQQTIHKWTR